MVSGNSIDSIIGEGIRHLENIEPRKRAVTEMNIGMFAEMKSFFRFNIWGGHGLAANDFYETRTTDQYFQKPPVWFIGYWWGTDNRKKLRFQSYGNTYIYQAPSRLGHEADWWIH